MFLKFSFSTVFTMLILNDNYNKCFITNIIFLAFFIIYTFPLCIQNKKFYLFF